MTGMALGIVALLGTLVAPASVSAQEAPACGLDIALVIDSSGSISSSDLSSVQTAFEGFVDVALGPDTQMTVIDFDDSATITQNWSGVAADIKTGINAGTSGGGTNWEAAINTAASQFPHRTMNNPDVVIFASDGNPTDPGSDADALNAAIAAADTAKGNGVFMKSIGIGSDIDGDNLAAISSDDSFIDSDFDQLASDLETLAQNLCDEVMEEEPKMSHTHVVTENGAVVETVFSKNANTGINSAFGSTGGNGGRGGAVTNNGSEEGESSADGNTGGNGGHGGTATGTATVVTGAALADNLIDQSINSTLTRIDRCACSGDEHGNDRVITRNTAQVGTADVLSSNSGLQSLGGSTGGIGGSGGRIRSTGGSADDNMGGRGGRGGTAGGDATARTGTASSIATLITELNMTDTIIRR